LPEWARPWVAWVLLAAHLVAPRVGANPHRQVHNRAVLQVDKVVQAVRQLVVKPAARVAHRAALRPDQHRVLVDRVVPNKLVAQVVPARRVQDPAVLRAVALAVLADKAAQVDWPWLQLAATPKCVVVSQPEPGRRHRDPLVSAVAHS
jgi:hypothetical protein